MIQGACPLLIHFIRSDASQVLRSLTGMWENGIRRHTWRLKKDHLGRFLISMRSFLRHGKRRASRTNSRTKGLGLIMYDQLLSGTENKNKRPPKTRPFSAPGAIAAAASPLFRQPRRTIHSDKARLIGKVRVSSSLSELLRGLDATRSKKQWLPRQV